MLSLIIHEVVYFLPQLNNFNERQRWTQKFFYENEASQFMASIQKENLISYKRIQTTSSFFTEVVCNNPYRYLAGTYVCLGDIHDARSQYSTTAFTTKELFDVAKIEYETTIKSHQKHQDSYYSQQWV